MIVCMLLFLMQEALGVTKDKAVSGNKIQYFYNSSIWFLNYEIQETEFHHIFKHRQESGK